VTVGTPPQKLRLLLDTGTSDTWVNVPDSTLCASAKALCSPFGTYNANSSSTYSYIGGGFNISSLAAIVGDYAEDTLTVGSMSFPSMQFGIAYSSTNPQGDIGIGYPTGESQVEKGGKPVYNNLPLQMVAQGLINSNAYSLWLNDLNASTGNILFGGVDTARYHGSLATVPLQEVGGSVSQFPITLTEMTFGSVVIAKNLALALALVSGNTLTYLPNPLAQAIYQEVGAFFDQNSGEAFIPCSQASLPGTLNFTFSSATIAVPMRELVLDVLDNGGSGNPATIGGQGTPACVFGIAPALGTPLQLGATFMRSAYLVFDMDNNEISLAQTNFNANGTDVVEIGTGKGSVPNATPVANAVSATQGTGVFASSTPTATSGLGANATVSGGERGAFLRRSGAMVIVVVVVLHALM
jgi:Eukaryotic aspartyl protease